MYRTGRKLTLVRIDQYRTIISVLQAPGAPGCPSADGVVRRSSTSTDFDRV